MWQVLRQLCHGKVLCVIRFILSTVSVGFRKETCCANVLLLQLFGLQASAAIAAATAESSALQQLLMRVQQQQAVMASAASSSATLSSSGELMERADALLSQLPPLFDLKEAGALRSHVYKNAMEAALLQEAARYNVLISLTKKTLQVLQVIVLSITGIAQHMRVNSSKNELLFCSFIYF